MNRSARLPLRAARLLGCASLFALGCSDKASPTVDASVGTDAPVVATAGGLPAGYTKAFATPAAAVGHEANYGYNPAIAFDAAGDPAVAFAWVDPNNDDDASDTAIYFAHWNHALGRFDAPALVGVAGDVTRRSHIISLAFDASTSTFGVAYSTYLQSNYDVALAFTTNGTTFTSAALGLTQTAPVQASLALAGGAAHLAYVSSEEAHYATGPETAAPSTWTTSTAANPPGTTHATSEPSIALDSAGHPAVAYFAPPSTAYNMSAVFWRPGSAPVVAFDSTNRQNDDPHLSLAFHGTAPSIVALLSRASGEATDVYLASSADGATWSAVVGVPHDNGASGGVPSLAIGAAGQGAVAYENNGGNGSDACGHPKLARSSNLTAWTTCSPDTAKALSINPSDPALGFGAGDRLVLAFNNAGSSSDGALGPGLWVWRE